MSTVIHNPQLTPRDTAVVGALKAQGLQFVEVRISQVSAAKGQLVENVALPSNTRVLAVLRDGRMQLSLHDCFLAEGDSVLLLTDDEDAVRHHFII